MQFRLNKLDGAGRQLSAIVGGDFLFCLKIHIQSNVHVLVGQTLRLYHEIVAQQDLQLLKTSLLDIHVKVTTRMSCVFTNIVSYIYM